jgi:CheY-like chemotaxis protein
MKSVITVMMIDDDTEDQEIFLEAVNDLDPSIVCVQPSSAALALNLMLEDNYNPDYIFVDLNMPVMDGFEFLTELKTHQLLTHIPVIVYTTSSETRHKEKAKQLGAALFMTKPVNFNLLKTELASVLMVGQPAAR